MKLIFFFLLFWSNEKETEWNACIFGSIICVLMILDVVHMFLTRKFCSDASEKNKKKTLSSFFPPSNANISRARFIGYICFWVKHLMEWLKAHLRPLLYLLNNLFFVFSFLLKFIFVGERDSLIAWFKLNLSAKINLCPHIKPIYLVKLLEVDCWSGSVWHGTAMPCAAHT